MNAWDTPCLTELPGSTAPLSPSEKETLLSTIAAQIVRRGWQTPVMWLLETHRPLAFTASQTVIGLTPILGPLLGAARLQQAARLFAEPGIVDELITRLEAPTESDGNR